MSELTPLQLDVIAESGNISMGSAATALSNLLGQSVSITTPRLGYTTAGEVRARYSMPCVLVRVSYIKGLTGNHILVLTHNDAGTIANMMMGDSSLPVPEILDEMYLSAVSEAMNQMMGSSATALADMFGRPVDISPPELEYVDLGSGQDISGLEDEARMIEVAFDFKIGEHINSTMLQLLPPEFAEQMVAELSVGLDLPEETSKIHPQASLEKFEYGNDIKLEHMEEDAISEIGNISMGAAATALSTLLDKRVDITTPRVSITTSKEVKSNFNLPCVVVKVKYSKGLEGENVLIIKESDAAIIGNLMMGDPNIPVPEKLDEIYLSAVSEAMNQMVGASATALSELINRLVDICPPETEYLNFAEKDVEIDEHGEDDPLVQVSFRMEIDDLIDSNLIQLMPLSFAREMIKDLLNVLHEPDFVPAVEEKKEVTVEYEPPARMEEALADALNDMQIDLIRDIPVQVSGLLGTRKIPLRRLLELSAGSIVDLNCAADEPLDVLANGKLVARGEIVLVNDRFGVKISEIIRPCS